MEQDNSDNNNTKEEDLELNDKPKAESVRHNSKLSELTNIIRRKPVIALTFISITIMVVSYFLSESGKTKESIIFIENRESREAISGIEQAVDLRAKWTEEILNEVKTLKDRFDSVIDSRYLEITAQINNFNQKLEILENQPKQSLYNNDSDEFSSDLNHNILNSPHDNKTEQAPVVVKPYVNLRRAGSEPKKNVENYVTSGSSARAVLLTGVVVGTGTNSSSSPEPIVLQLLDTAILYNKYKTDQIKNAILIGSCNGEMSSERAKCRIETLSVVNNQGDIIEKKVEGWLIGEDGRSGIKGIVVDKSSNIASMAALNGVFSSIAKFLQSKAIKPDMLPTLNLVAGGQQQEFQIGDALQSGAYAGASNAFDKLADFAIKRADSMSPVVLIASGRVIDVVFKKGFDLLEHKKKPHNSTYSPSTNNEKVNLHNKFDQSQKLEEYL
ncbi:bacterial conjugation TrbI-like family protein [Orientia tsutsugamushi str. Gilliam]|uniref:Bacterial conjugation TrbI-like family protein n=1 Tax=Orientia tsutsugamushi str. Gilliam TaxID=1359184 RepID=A0A0F3MAL5_ORITS|nr:TraB/VirB10 family protein [Orientia tsutsugamushi]KJV52803.1 bacterial conjugation TrbI-like family protein [Orientia tsutsugamushi str. Gilliam]SPR08755.1 conjugal transfer protein [Orientia tsutsugamushi str. Gilliam]SPR10008.1 conjugal transfer protein [Orientia tsutsugamushi str. Gilliam]